MNNHESLEVIEKSVRLKLKEKLAIIEEKYGDSGNNKEDALHMFTAFETDLLCIWSIN